MDLSRRTFFAALPTIALPRARGAALFEETFRCPGFFDYREIVPSTPERSDNWAVKVTQLGDGRLLMVWCSTADIEVSRSNKLWQAWSADEGATWSEPRLLAASAGEDRVLNPAVYTHEDGRVLLFYNSGDAFTRFDLVLRTSRDGGATWSEPRVLPFGETVLTSVMSPPVRLASGAIVLPISYSRPRRRANHFLSTVLLSTDGGERWKQGGEMHLEVERGAMEPAIAEVSPGELYCLMRTKAGFQYESRSRDGGLSWTAPQPSLLAGPESTAILLRLQSGPLLCAWNGNGLSGGKQVPRYPLTVALSEDGGRSWRWRRVVATAAGEHQLSNHGLFQTRSGRILLTTNHYQGMRDGRGVGPLEQARFDEAWVRGTAPPDRWEEAPAPTGGIRPEPAGVTLFSGAAAGETTLLKCRRDLPPRGAVEIEVAGVEGTLGDGVGLFFGHTPQAGRAVALARGRQRVEITGPGPWGLYARNDGSQTRMTVRVVRVLGAA